MLEVETLHNVELVVNQAEKHPGNPLLPTGDLNDFDMRQASTWAGSVIFDEDEKIFRLWYIGGDWPNLVVGYAWSKDGVVWHKPKLGLYEYKGGKENNICWLRPHFVVTKDYKEKDSDKRYKGFTRGGKEQNYKGFPIYSPDGIRWTARQNPIQYPYGDITNLVIDSDDPDPQRRIKIYGCAGGLGHHNMGYGSDIEHCVQSPSNPVIDPNEGLEYTIHLFFVLRYKDYYIMIYDFNLWLDYYGYKGHVETRKKDRRVREPKTGIFVGDVRLAVSRDGIGKFQRVNPWQPVVARGERGQRLLSHARSNSARRQNIHLLYRGK